jgi:hypothetical protein
MGPKPEPIAISILPIDVIDKKIAKLEEFSQNKDITRKDREAALVLLSDYKKIRSIVQDGLHDHDYRDIIQSLFNSLDKLDEEYLLNRPDFEDNELLSVINNYSQRKREIGELFLSENYQAVVSKSYELEEDFGRNSITPDIGLILAMSLAEENRLSEAIQISENVALELEGKPDLIDLRAQNIEWLLKADEKEKALKLYDKLVDDVNEKDAIYNDLRQRLFDDEEDDLENLEEFFIEDLLYEASSLSEPGRAKELLHQVERLIMEESYSEARLVLLRWRLRVEGTLEENIIEKALDIVSRAEKRPQREEPTKNENVENAEKLIEQEKFKEALEILNSEPEGDPDIQNLRNLAVEHLINSERNRAAKLFLEAKNTDDPKIKLEILLSSYRILEALIESYPSSNLIEKLNNHIESVRDEIEKLSE